jgi:hypothetical protein
MLALLVVALAIAGSCQRSIFRQYEYEEEIYLKLDGSATVVVNASIAALVALRGLEADPTPSARVDRDHIREFYESPAVRGARVGRPWRRSGRRFVQIRLQVDDIRKLARAKPFDWSTYRFDKNDGQFHYHQTWGPATGKPVSDANWDGSELVAVRMHLPSRIDYHNATSRRVDRGNIVRWEQPLRERLRGQPLAMEVRIETRSILYRTLTIFGIALGASLLLMALIVMWIRRKGAADARPV